MARSSNVLKIKLQVYHGEEIAMGPGKADLVDAIGEHGSISAAAKALGMSYRRAWLLVDTMNRCWRKPLIETAPGGQARAGARVTPFGRDVVAQYRALQDGASDACGGPDWNALSKLLKPSRSS